MEYKALPFAYKADDTGTPGVFTGKASVYGVIDLGNDVVMPGAFTETLEELANEILIANAHDQKDVIGTATLADSPEALLVKEGRLELELPTAQATHIRMKKGLVKGLSIGYAALKAKKVAGKRELHRIKLFEVSPVSFPMLPAASIAGVKGMFDAACEELKAGALSGQSKALLARMFGEDEARRLEVKFVEGDLDGKREAIAAAIRALFPNDYGWVSHVFEDHGIYCKYEGRTERYWRVNVTVAGDQVAASAELPVEVERYEGFKPKGAAELTALLDGIKALRHSAAA